MTPLEKAIAIALEAHAGQKDKGGKEYILHPLRVMGKMDTDEEKITAVLHDVVEDSDFTLQFFKEKGISDTILTALTLLAKDKTDMPYMDYIKKIKSDPLARNVKLADLQDNMDLTRLISIGQKDLTGQKI